MVYGQQGVILPLSELIETHGLETRSVFKQYPILQKIMTAHDGNIYALPRINEITLSHAAKNVDL